jgi:hypothetical protein
MIALIKEEMEASGHGVVSRIYSPDIGEFDKVVHEMEFQDMAERQEFWDRWRATRATPEFWQKFNKLRRPGGRVAIWRLAE